MSAPLPPLFSADDAFVAACLKMLRGEIDEAACDALAKQLDADADKRRLYVHLAIQSQVIGEVLSLHPVDEEVDESQGPYAADIMAEVIESIRMQQHADQVAQEAADRAVEEKAKTDRDHRERLRLVQQVNGRPVPRVIIIPKLVAVLGLAAVVALMVVGIVAFQPDKPAPRHTETPDPPTHNDALVTSDTVATLTLTDDAVWSGTHQSLPLHSRITPGPLHLESGIAHLVMDSGAVVMIKGPVTIDLSSAWVAELSEGSAVARVPERAQGFKIVGDGFAITDLGTEFAVHVGEDGMQCRVVLGEVELALPGQDGSNDATHRLLENRLTRVDTATGTVSDLGIEEADDIAWALPYTELLNRNLVINGDFEDGPTGGLASSAARPENVTIPGWDDDGPATMLDYEQSGAVGEAGFPSPATDIVPDNRGDAYYVGCSPGTMTQTVSLIGLAEVIAAGHLKFIMSGDLGGLGDQNDHAYVTLTFLDEAARGVGKVSLPIVDAETRGGVTAFQSVESSGVVPDDARHALISVTAVHRDGILTDAYADNLSLRLHVDSGLAQGP